jgi:hypothetical protein
VIDDYPRPENAATYYGFRIHHIIPISTFDTMERELSEETRR